MAAGLEEVGLGAQRPGVGSEVDPGAGDGRSRILKEGRRGGA